MRVWPHSLFGRLFIATVAAVMITMSIILLLIVRERQELALLESAASESVANIAATVQGLARMSPPERANEISELRAQRRGMAQTRRARRSVRRELLERAVVTRLQERLGDKFAVRAQEPGRPPHDSALLFVDRPPEMGPPGMGPEMFADRLPFTLEVVLPDGEAVSFRMPPPRPGPSMPKRIFVYFGLLTLALTTVLFLMTRTITRPLAKLARAADAVGRGTNVEPLREEGGRELRAATRAFNAMQERLRRYLDSRTRVLAAMSHDMRTPLTRLRLRVESIEDEQLRARCTADLDEMNEMIRGALAMFRGLNDEEQASPIDINALLEALRNEHIELGGVVTLIGRTDKLYIGKPLALRRCLGNLIQNAIQYGGEANITVADSADRLTIFISDRGPGIPIEALDQVFEPFFRLEASRNRDTGGAGLGLSIARDIAQAHGGTLTLSNADKGLQAELQLPRHHAR